METKSNLSAVGAHLKELLDKTYGDKVTKYGSHEMFNYLIDGLVIVAANNCYGTSYMTSIIGEEIVVQPEDYTCKARARHIKKITDEKIIAAIEAVMIEARANEVIKQQRRDSLMRMDKEKKELAALQETETAPYENSFPNLKLYNSNISRQTDGNYKFSGEFRAPLNKMVEILKIIEENH